MAGNYFLIKDRAECLLALTDKLKQSFISLDSGERQSRITDIENATVLWVRKQNDVDENIVKVVTRLAADNAVKDAPIYIVFPYISQSQSSPLIVQLEILLSRNCRITWLAAKEDDNGKNQKSEIQKICNKLEIQFVSMKEYVLEQENESTRIPWEKMQPGQKRFMYVEYRLRYLYMGQNKPEFHLRDIIVELVKEHGNGSFGYTVPLLAREMGSGRLSTEKTQNLVKRFVDKGCLAIAGKSASIDVLKRRIVKYAMLDLHVMISGESGTGKENAAYFIHELGHRRTHPCIDINCAGLSDELFVSTLFGHAKGSFSGANSDHSGLVEEAKDGCIFLDELHQLSKPCQAKLLRFLQSGEYYRLGENTVRKVRCRVIAAGQPRGLSRKLLPDLYNRLAVAELHLPSIAELQANGEDIITIAYNRSDALRGEHCVVENDDGTLSSFTINRGHVKAFWQLIDRYRDLVLSYDWPGNTREMVVAIQQNMLYGEPLDEIIRRKIKNREKSPSVSANTVTRRSSEIESLPIDTSVNGCVAFLPATQSTELLTVEELQAAYVQHVYAYLGKELGKGHLCHKLGIRHNETFNSYLLSSEERERLKSVRQELNKAKRENLKKASSAASGIKPRSK